MSFILDALKKSENDRQRQSGPALFEVRVPAPRSKFPLLAVAIVGLLVVNLGVVGWLMLREPAEAAVPPAPQAGAPPSQGGPAPQGPNPQVAGFQPPPVNGAPPGYGAAVPGPNGYAPNGNPQGPNGYPAAGQGYPPANTGYPPPNNGYPSAANGGANGPAVNGYPPSAQNNFPSANTGPPANAGGYAGVNDPRLADGAEPEELNPDDYAPAREPGLPGADAGRVIRSTESGLPTYEQAASRTSIPAIRLDLHSYAPDPAKRFVLINMKRLYEGQSLPEGVKLERITTDAAILSYNGTSFVLNRN